MARFKYLLDTHAFLWAATDEERLSNKASRAIGTTPHEQLAITDVTLQEMGLLLNSGRIVFKGSPATILGSMLNCLTVFPINLEIAITAPELGLPHGDQFDRIITATAKIRRLPLITRDANIGASSEISAIW
jgi:PIN domain nuclease of toxin-antitoxin system